MTSVYLDEEMTESRKEINCSRSMKYPMEEKIQILIISL